MTDADRAAAPLIRGAFDLAAGAGPAAPAANERPPPPLFGPTPRTAPEPYALALNRLYFVNRESDATVRQCCVGLCTVGTSLWGVRVRIAPRRIVRDDDAPAHRLPRMDHNMCTHYNVFFT